jgi:peptidoglycan L-alanyl-D-glutamate endopeptidase CwlK
MSRDLNLLDARFRPMADAFLAACASVQIDVIVTCTFRSSGEQMALYNQGRLTPGPIVTNAKPGQSAHNYGMAIDVVPVVNGKCDWNGHDLVWQEIGHIGQSRGMTWLGAPGSSFPEMAHFEHPNWRELSLHLSDAATARATQAPSTPPAV